MNPLPELVTQAQWATHVGVSTSTFLRWRRDGVKTKHSGVIQIPAPVDLPGWPRWKREDVVRISQLLRNGKRRLSIAHERLAS